MVKNLVHKFSALVTVAMLSGTSTSAFAALPMFTPDAAGGGAGDGGAGDGGLESPLGGGGAGGETIDGGGGFSDGGSIDVSGGAGSPPIMDSGGGFGSGSIDGAQSMGTVISNSIRSVANTPTAVSAVCWIGGLGIGVSAVLRLKEHVDKHGQVPMREGLIRLATAGSLLSMPFVYAAMQGSVAGDQVATVASITPYSFTLPF